MFLWHFFNIPITGKLLVTGGIFMLRDFTKQPFDIIIQAGQSNSEGTGFGEASSPYTPKDTVWYLNADMTISIAGETVWENQIQSNYSLSFADEYIRCGLLEDGRNLLILRTSVGGTGFSDHRWGLSDDLYLHMMKMIRTALELNKENRLVAFLWHQGEADALAEASFETHYKNLETLLSQVRKEFACPELSFVAGDFVPQWVEQNEAICAPVVQAIRAVCANCGDGAFVESTGLLSNAQVFGEKVTEIFGWEDTVHFCRDALYELGRRYFAAFRQIQSGK